MSERISNRIREARLARGWSQERLAAMVGIARQSLAAAESGAAVPSTEIALRLARAFGCAVEKLFSLPDAPPQSLEVEVVGGAPFGSARVRLAQVGGRTLAFPLRAAGMRPLQAADGVAEGGGGRMRVALLPERPPEPALVVMGCDPSFPLLAEWLRRERGLEALWLQQGSRRALEALARGEAHVAGVHLVDPESGEYNEPWIRRLVPFACTRIGFAVWEETLMVRQGNPLGIRGVQDLARPALRFVNREPGSGTRALLDARLAGAGIAPDAVSGYAETAAAGHLAVAEAVAAGSADAGIGIRAAALAFGLDALPLASERYDLVIPNHFLELPAVQALLEVLRRPGLAAQVEALGGYDTAPMGLPA